MSLTKPTATLTWGEHKQQLWVTRWPASQAGPIWYQVEGHTRTDGFVDFEVETIAEVAQHLFALGFTADEILSLTKEF